MRRSCFVAALLVLACGDDGSSETTGSTGSSTSSTGGASTSATGPTTSGSAEGSGSGTETTGGSGSTAGSGSSGSSSSSGTSSGSDSSTGTTGGVGVNCNATSVECDGLPPECPPGEVPEVVAGCWGECVAVLMCATEESCDGCQVGLCVEYQAFTVEYRCVSPSLTCAALNCPCLGPFVCADPFDACGPSIGDAAISCSCPTC